MSLESILYIILPVLASLMAYLMRSVMARIETLEHQIQSKLNEPAVRMIISDKVDPIREDIHEIKETLNKLLDIYMNGKSNE